jgi:hypothetical protein
MYNISPHSFISIKIYVDCNHLFHEECGNSITNIDQRVVVERMLI